MRNHLFSHNLKIFFNYVSRIIQLNVFVLQQPFIIQNRERNSQNDNKIIVFDRVLEGKLYKYSASPLVFGLSKRAKHLVMSRKRNLSKRPAPGTGCWSLRSHA